MESERSVVEIDMGHAFCCCTELVSWYNRTMNNTAMTDAELETARHHQDILALHKARVTLLACERAARASRGSDLAASSRIRAAKDLVETLELLVNMTEREGGVWTDDGDFVPVRTKTRVEEESLATGRRYFIALVDMNVGPTWVVFDRETPASHEYMDLGKAETACETFNARHEGARD